MNRKLFTFQVKRSPSLRSEHSSVSESRQVRFNQDVSVKRIPKKVVKTKSLPLEAKDEFSGKCQQFTNLPPPASEQEIASEAEAILRYHHHQHCLCKCVNSQFFGFQAFGGDPVLCVCLPHRPGQLAAQVSPMSSESDLRHFLSMC